MATKLSFNQLLNHEDVDLIFNLEEEIAAGSFGTVYKGTHLPTGKVLAVKIITPEEDEVPEDLMVEIAVLKQCKHKNIVEFFGGYRKGDEIFIALELCNCSVRDIFEYSEEPLLEKEIALITKETLKGLDYMHKNNLIHRDVKGANILLTDDGDVKLVDFGVSSLNAKKAKTFVGTPYWMAPEIIESKNTLSGYGPEIDIWALGITLIELAETSPPLSYINPMRALFQIPARDPPTLEKKQRWSPLFHDFLSKCLEKNPKKRPSAVELMNHPFVRDCDDNKKILTDFIKRKKRYEASSKGENFEEEEIPDFSALPQLNSSLPQLNTLPQLNSVPPQFNNPNPNPQINPNPNPQFNPNPNPISQFNPNPNPQFNPNPNPQYNPNPNPQFNPGSPQFNPNPNPQFNPGSPPFNPNSNPNPQFNPNAQYNSNPPQPQFNSGLPDFSPTQSPNYSAATTTQSSDFPSDFLDDEDFMASKTRSQPLSQSSNKWVSQGNLNQSGIINPNNNNNLNNGKMLGNQRSSMHSYEEGDNPKSYSSSDYSSASSPNILGSPLRYTDGGNGSIQNGEYISSPLRQKSTLKRPPPTNREGNNPNQYNQMKAINKRIIKEQMGELRNLQNRLQKKIERLEKDNQRERDQFQALIKKNVELVERKVESQKRSMERQHKTDLEGLVRSQQKEQRNLVKHHEGESKAFQRDIKEQVKVATKNHLDSQKNRGKDQKNELRDSKRKLNKSELKLLEKQHRVELQINELFFQKAQDRARIFKEQEIVWTQQNDQNKNRHAELQQSQQMELDSAKQMFGTDVEAHNEIFSYKQEEITKFQPVFSRQMSELHQMQIQNLQQQLDLEKTQQTTLMLTDQRAQTKDFREKKKKMEKDMIMELKNIEKNSRGRSKPEIKSLQNDYRAKFVEKQLAMDKEFEDRLQMEREEDEQQMTIHQNMQHESLLKKQKEEINELQLEHTKQQSDFHADEIGDREKMLLTHQTKIKELLDRHHKEQSDLLDVHHQELLMLMKRTQKSSIEMVENQRKELLAFIAINTDKILADAVTNFNQQIDEHFDEIINQMQKEHQNNQRALSAEMETQHAELQEQQKNDKNTLEEFQQRQTESSIFTPMTVSIS